MLYGTSVIKLEAKYQKKQLTAYFNIPFEFGEEEVYRSIDQLIKDKNKGYVCVVDGNIIAEVQSNSSYAHIIHNSVFNICDSSWTPLFIKWIYGIKYKSLTGNDLFIALLSKRVYRSFFVGATPEVLSGLKEKLHLLDPGILDEAFLPLPFCPVEEFDYNGIAKVINDYSPDLIWISLGAPKQEEFMSRLLPNIDHGLLLAVGAVFNYHSGITEKKRAPEIFIRMKLEWLFRTFQEPVKNLRRDLRFIGILPGLLFGEIRRARKSSS